MASLSVRSRRIGDQSMAGWVDALSSLVMVIMFVLMVFVLAQFALTVKLMKPNDALNALTKRAEQLADMLTLERATSGDLHNQVGVLTAQLASLEADHARLLQQAPATDKDLAAEQAVNAQAREQIAQLTQEIEALRQQLAALSTALEISEKATIEQKVQVAELGRRLNGALASKVTELEHYRSEFFGRLRDKLADRPGIRVVGDRFVVQSEVLFASGQAELGEDGKVRLAELAQTLKAVTANIPNDIDWVLRVDGHTDNRPVHSAAYPTNWELSSARAIAVLKFLNEQGIPSNRLAATGFGEFQPIDPGTSDAALAKNRRIELRFDSR